jgi:UDP-N-acetylmuramate-alanine ligase
LWIDEYNAYAKHTKSYAVLTGKISGITVLDFDSLNSYKTFCKNVPDFENYFTVKTKNGYHVYCLYNPELKTCNNVLKKFRQTNYAVSESRS